MVLLLCIQNSLVPGSDGQKVAFPAKRLPAELQPHSLPLPCQTLERRERLEEEVWATLTSNKREGYSTEVPNAARHQPASVHNKSTTHTDSTHTTHTQIAHTRRTQIAHTRHTQTFARDTLPSESKKDTGRCPFKFARDTLPSESKKDKGRCPIN